MCTLVSAAVKVKSRAWTFEKTKAKAIDPEAKTEAKTEAKAKAIKMWPRGASRTRPGLRHCKIQLFVLNFLVFVYLNRLTGRSTAKISQNSLEWSFAT